MDWNLSMNDMEKIFDCMVRPYLKGNSDNRIDYENFLDEENNIKKEILTYATLFHTQILKQKLDIILWYPILRAIFPYKCSGYYKEFKNLIDDIWYYSVEEDGFRVHCEKDFKRIQTWRKLTE